MGRSGTHKLSSTQRGLGQRHKQRRATLLRELVDGTPCDWCGEPMHRSQDLAADHTLARAHGGKLADRLLHFNCNSARQSGDRDHLAPALGGSAALQRSDLGVRVMTWV